MSGNDPYLPFSQRNGYSPLPPQLQVGEVSSELRRLIDYAIHEEVERVKRSGTMHPYFDGAWLRVSKDFHVRFLGVDIQTYENDAADFKNLIDALCKHSEIDRLFDAVEFFARHSGTTPTLKTDLANCFVEARAAYRLVDGLVIVLGNGEQAQAVEAALTDAEMFGAKAARAHLVSAGVGLRKGDWADSIRDSIHAVEAVARQLDASAKTLGPALSELERRGHLHPALKKALSALYGYTSDEAGVRHAKVFEDTASVDETDALFMLGVCASFVSYLLARSDAENEGQEAPR